MIKACICFIAAIVLISCGSTDKLPDDILPPEKMQYVLWDIMRAEVMTTDILNTDTTRTKQAKDAKLQVEIFAIHGITREQYYKSYVYYKSRPVLFKPVLDSVLAIAERNNEKFINRKITTKPF